MACVKICITGPESTGKSTLTKALSEQFQFPFVKELARGYLDELGRKHKLEDLFEMAKLQLKAMKEKTQDSSVFFYDTDLITLKIWAKDKYESELQIVEENYFKEKSELYLLCYPDLKWEPDALREDENRLSEIYSQYLKLLQEMEVEFVVIKGEGQTRNRAAQKAVKVFLEKD